MEAGRRGGTLALVSSEIHGLGSDGHPSVLCASVSPAAVGGWCRPRAVWLQTRGLEELTGKALGKCSLCHGGELTTLIFFETFNTGLT